MERPALAKKPESKKRDAPRPAAKPAPKLAPKPAPKLAQKPAGKPASKVVAKPAPKAPAKAPPAVKAPAPAVAKGKPSAKIAPGAPAPKPAPAPSPAQNPAQARGKAAATAPGKPTPAKSPPASPAKVNGVAPKPAAGKPATPAAPALKGAPKGSEKPADKKAAGKAPPAKAEKPPKPEKAPKPEKKKKGPIDLTTAKSVAAVAAASQADSSGYVIINGRRVRMISTKGLPTPKRIKPVAEKEAEKPEIQVATIKTKLSKKELDDFKALLLAKRRQIAGMLSGLEDEALRSNGGNLSNMPLHMADIGTDTFDQDFTLGMAQTERQLLDEINAALNRIENRTYGVCQLTGKPIPKSRLDAKPWAKHTVEAAKLVERGMAPR